MDSLSMLVSLNLVFQVIKQEYLAKLKMRKLTYKGHIKWSDVSHDMVL